MGRRLNIEAARQAGIERGFLCLSETYVNNKTKLEWLCIRNHRWFSVLSHIKSERGCPMCSGKQKLSLDIARMEAERHGGVCLSDHYIDGRTLMRWRCALNHEWESRLDSIRNSGTWCPFCSEVARITIEEVHEWARSKGGSCLETEFINSTTSMRWRCALNHEWVTFYGRIKHGGTWCPFCAGCTPVTLNDACELAKNRGGECLSQTCSGSNDKLRWRCSEFHEWECHFFSVRNNNTWCPICAGNARLSISCADQVAAARNGKCLSIAYKNIKSYLMWECDKFHRWEATLESIKNCGTWCPQCSESKGERKLREIFNSRKIPFISQLILGDLPRKRFDLQYNLEENMIIIEYDGEQHFHQIDYFGSKDRHQEWRVFDQLKTYMAIKSGYKIIRIDYTQFKNIEEHILKAEQAFREGYKFYFSSPELYDFCLHPIPFEEMMNNAYEYFCKYPWVNYGIL